MALARVLSPFTKRRQVPLFCTRWLTLEADFHWRETTDGVIVGINESDKLSQIASHIDELSSKKLSRLIGLSGNKVKPDSCRLFFDLHPKIPRLALVAYHTQREDETRRAVAIASRALAEHGARFVQIDPLASMQAAAEGALLGTFSFDQYKSEKGKELESISPLCLKTDLLKYEASLRHGLIHAKAQNYARHLAETPANFMTPTIFDHEVSKLRKYERLSIITKGKEFMIDQQMRALLAVAKGSAEEPRWVEIHYNGGQGKPVVLVGKGITFDSGGISIKGAANMGLMKGDMGGAAAVAATMMAIAELKLEINVIGIIPLCENMPSGTATRPGDVVQAMSGIHIEIDNTDAEGRLILADALHYSTRFNPAAIIDVATLTGAIDVALGFHCSGWFSNNADFFSELANQASSSTQEILHFMPIGRDHEKAIKSSVADIVNSTSTRSAGACTAAAFLKHFVPSTIPWMHIDMAGVMHSTKVDGYHTKGMTGRPTRALIQLAQLAFAKANSVS